MRVFEIRNIAAGVALLFGCAFVARAADVLISDPKSSPESLTVAPGGAVIVGSASSPFVYKIKPHATTAEKFIDASAEPAGTFFFGMLAEPATKTLWTCQLTPVAESTPPRRHTALRSFDLESGAPKIRWDLPGDSNVCNDFAIGPDRALYITDTSNAKIYRLPAGAKTADLFASDPLLRGIDGITFLNGTLYVNSVTASKIFRIPVTDGKAGTPVEITLDQPIKGPDGMRAANGKIFVAENGAGKITALTINGDKGTVAVLKDGLKTPTGIEPAGDTLWFTERATGMVMSIPMPK